MQAPQKIARFLLAARIGFSAMESLLFPSVKLRLITPRPQKSGKDEKPLALPKELVLPGFRHFTLYSFPPTAKVVKFASSKS